MLAPLDLISAHPWRRTAYTTYALSLSFFEAVILDALVRGGGREALILADVAGARAALSEQGARRVGKDYDVEPVMVRGGVFHPKLSVLIGDDECHLLVGSGNLTFGGWGGNLEIIEHLHPTFAADAIEDAADLFDRLSSASRLRHGAGQRCGIRGACLRISETCYGADATEIPHEIVAPFQRWVTGLHIINTIFFRSEHLANYELWQMDARSLKNWPNASPSLLTAIGEIEWPILRVTVPGHAMDMLPHFAVVAHELERIPLTFEHSPRGERSFCILVG
jgi:hypothetical protein